MLNRILIVVYTLIAIPWYWGLLPQTWAMRSAFGLPMWAFVASAGSLGVSIHTAMLFMKPWENENDEDPEPDEAAS